MKAFIFSEYLLGKYSKFVVKTHQEVHIYRLFSILSYMLPFPLSYQPKIYMGC